MNRELLLAEWRRSVRALAAARLLAREGYAEDAVSRTYYAILHAAKAALLAHGVTVDSHAALRRQFGQHLVRSGNTRFRSDFEALSGAVPITSATRCTTAINRNCFSAECKYVMIAGLNFLAREARKW